MTITEILTIAVEKKASDIFIVAGLSVGLRVEGKIEVIEGEKLMPKETETVIREMYEIAGRPMDRLLATGDDDYSFALRGLSRFRVSAFKQRGSLSAVIRIISFHLPDPDKMRIPQAIIELGDVKSGMVLVTGPAGSGKSTTLACIIDHINKTRNANIITLEDPIEFLHSHDKSIVNQREMNVDSENYVTALRAALRQSPDVVLLGEMRDFETIAVAMTAAETGHYLLSTLHTVGAANTINRIIDVFPANQQRQIAVQLSMVLTAVVSQQLIPSKEGKVVPAFEIMRVTPAIRNMIRENKIYQIEAAMRDSKDNMLTMDANIQRLYEEGVIDKETALIYAINPETLEKRLR